MADILDKSFKTTILKMLKKLKEDVKKVKKTMCKQNGNIGKDPGNLKINQKEIRMLKSTIIEIKKTHPMDSKTDLSRRKKKWIQRRT